MGQAQPKAACCCTTTSQLGKCIAAVSITVSTTMFHVCAVAWSAHSQQDSLSWQAPEEDHLRCLERRGGHSFTLASPLSLPPSMPFSSPQSFPTVATCFLGLTNRMHLPLLLHLPSSWPPSATSSPTCSRTEHAVPGVGGQLSFHQQL